MTKEEIENMIYDKIIELGIELRLNKAPVNKTHFDMSTDEPTLFECVENYFRNESKWHIIFAKDLDTGYYSLESHSWNRNDNREPDVFLYLSEEEINDEITDSIRKMKLDNILD